MTYVLVGLLILFSPLILILLGLVVFPKPLFAVADKKIAKALDVDTYNKQSAYSLPGFLPVHQELQNAEITVEGEIPAELNGVYLRNGTNNQFETTQARMHMFNGSGMLHQINISNGAATYSNTFTKTPKYEIEKQAGKELYMEFGDLAGGGKPGFAKLIAGLLKKRFGVVPKLDNLEASAATTAIQFHHGKLYCLQETGYPFALNVKNDNGQLTIDGTGEWETFGCELKSPFTAHPKIHPETGDWYTFNIDFMNSKVDYGVLSQGQYKASEPLVEASPPMAFLHDYFITDNFSVFPDLSMRFDSKNLMNDEIKSPFYFDSDYKMRFGVIKRDHKAGEEVQWFTTDIPGHIWHTINGWEEKREDGGTDIILYTPVFGDYPSNVPIHSPEEPHAYLYKFRLNIETGEVTEQRKLLDHFYERPSFNTAYAGKPSRYAYLLDEQGSGGIMAKGVLKYDLLDEKEVSYFDYNGYLGGEALFVPKDNAVNEDDGYLVDLLMNDEKAYLAIIDAANMEEVAKLHLPQRVPYGVHSCWLDQQKIAQL